MDWCCMKLKILPLGEGNKDKKATMALRVIDRS